MNLNKIEESNQLSQEKKEQIRLSLGFTATAQKEQKSDDESKRVIIAANENFSIIQSVKPVDFFYELKRN